MNNKLYDNIDPYDVMRYVKSLGYNIFKNTSNKNHNINIWNVRSETVDSGKFDDVQLVCEIYGNKITTCHIYSITTDPSRLSLFRMKNPLGTAIVAGQQIEGMWYLDYHKGRKDHPALRQKKACTVIRDVNKDDILDHKDTRLSKLYVEYRKFKLVTNRRNSNDIIYTYMDDAGNIMLRLHYSIHGINCHRASRYKILEMIGPYSEGCIVHENPYRYYGSFIPSIIDSVAVWGNSLTMTMINEYELNKFKNG